MPSPDPKEIRVVLQTLKKYFPNPGAMEVGNPYQMLVAVILSARTRDEQVLKFLPRFFARFPTPQKLSEAFPKEIEAEMNTIGMYRQKAKNLKKMAGDLVVRFGGKVPDTMENLLSLAGVGRKTASVVLVAHFHQSAVAVDTHVHRVTNRLGWVKARLPEKTEQALLKLISSSLQPIVNRVFVKFGRSICIPGRPRCWMCPVRDACRFPDKNLAVPKNADAIRADIERREAALEASRREVVRALAKHSV